MTSIVIPGTVEFIDSYAFMDSGLKEVKFCEGFKELGQMAFYGTDLTEVVLPASVTDIHDLAFSGCSLLTDITVLSSSCSIYYTVNNLTGSEVGSALGDFRVTVVHGWKGSTAEAYAKRWHYKFVALTKPKSGWQKENGKWYWYDDNKKVVSSWVTDGGKEYYVDASGVMATGWKVVDGEYYYFGTSGAKNVSKWVKSGGKWYWLKADGVMAHGESLTIGGKEYMFNGSGVMLTGWQQGAEGWYFLGDDGAVKHGWQYSKKSDEWYYLDPETGVMATGWLTVDGATFYLRKTGGVAGSMYTGWQQVDGDWYWFDTRAGSGHRGEMFAEEWLKSGGKWYWLKADGKMAANESLTIDGESYTFDANGVWVK